MKFRSGAKSISAAFIHSLSLILALGLALGASQVQAQAQGTADKPAKAEKPKNADKPQKADKTEQAPEAEESDEAQAAKVFSSLGKKGPYRAQISNIAEIDVPADYYFIPQDNLNRFNKLYGNLPVPSELAALQHNSGDHFIVFQWSDEGYVKDDEKIDADELLANMQEGTKEGNKFRKEQGLADLELVGWEKPPFYDPKTNNLSWATRLKSDDGFTVNYNTKLLGRRGVMSVILVVDPSQLQSTLPKFEKNMATYSYVSGQKYSEWKSGDKVAAYGLGALVGGGAMAVAAKSGLLGKMLKPLLVFGAVAFAGIAKFFKRIFGRSAST